MESKEMPVNVEIENVEITEVTGKMRLKVGDAIRETEFKRKVNWVIS
jgi:hypothetical protein